MDEEYDIVILGTGLKECVLSGILSKEGMKVLHMDRNDYYGGASASLTPLDKVYEHFKKTGKPEEAKFGRTRDYNIDLIPKFLMANGSLVKALVYSGVTRYLEFKSVEGSYVYKHSGKVWKVPSTPKEALTSSLVGMFQKNYLRKFLSYVNAWKQDDPTTHKSGAMAPNVPMQKVFDDFGLDKSTQDFIGHAVALHRDDTYKSRGCAETILKAQLYADSVQRYGSSPYLYPLYGLGELPQGFARLSAIYGGTYMLARPIEGFDETDGKVTAVRAPDPDDENQAVKPVKTKMVLGDPSYFPDKCKKIGRVARCICILDHPLPSTKGTHPSGGAYSAQIIVPANQIMPEGSKKHDVYVCAVSSAHKVAADGRWIAIVSTQLETNDADKELQTGLNLCGPILEKFQTVDDMYAPNGDGKSDNCFISTSYDATTHFESTFEDINSLYTRITGKVLDLTKVSEETDGADQ